MWGATIAQGWQYRPLPDRLDRLWAASELPPWCRVVEEPDAPVEFGVAATDALHHGEGWIDVRRAAGDHAELPEVVIELDDVVVSSRGGVWKGNDLKQFFADQKHTIVFPPDLSLPEQFALFRRARSVVDELGSGMHWALACAPGTSIIYLRPRSVTKAQPFDPNRKSWMRAIADACGLHFGRIMASPKQWHSTVPQSDHECATRSVVGCGSTAAMVPRHLSN